MHRDTQFVSYSITGDKQCGTQDGKKYPPTTTRSLLSGLNRILKELKAPFSILDKGNPAFRKLLLTLDTVTSDLHREGVGVSKKSASVIPFEHEKVFWERKLLGCDTPKSLQRAVFYSVGLHFVLRGVQEHHDLQVEQLTRCPADTRKCTTNTKNSSPKTSNTDSKISILLTNAPESTLCPILIGVWYVFLICTYRNCLRIPQVSISGHLTKCLMGVDHGIARAGLA